MNDFLSVEPANPLYMYSGCVSENLGTLEIGRGVDKKLLLETAFQICSKIYYKNKSGRKNIHHPWTDSSPVRSTSFSNRPMGSPSTHRSAVETLVEAKRRQLRQLTERFGQAFQLIFAQKNQPQSHCWNSCCLKHARSAWQEYLPETLGICWHRLEISGCQNVEWAACSLQAFSGYFGCVILPAIAETVQRMSNHCHVLAKWR